MQWGIFQTGRSHLNIVQLASVQSHRNDRILWTPQPIHVAKLYIHYCIIFCSQNLEHTSIIF